MLIICNYLILILQREMFNILRFWKKIRAEQKEQSKMLAAIMEKLSGLDVEEGVPDDVIELTAYEKLRNYKNFEKLL